MVHDQILFKTEQFLFAAEERQGKLITTSRNYGTWIIMIL